MEPRAHHVLIGLFTVISLIGALLFALWLGRSNVERDLAYYEIIFEQAVSGLAEGNAVQYNGIVVGNVANLRLDPEDPRKVHALIRVAASTPITTDTRARLALANITGSMNIQLQGGTPDSPRLVGTLQDPAVIEAARSPLSSLLDDSETLIAASDRLLTRANQLLSEENLESISNLLANLDRLSASLANNSENVEPLLKGLNTMAEQAEQAMASVGAAGNSARTLLDESGQQALASARQAMQSLAAASQRLKQMGEDHSGDIDGALRGLGRLDPAMRELRETLSRLSLLLRKFDENPTDTLLGGDALEEFSP
jgi:phospholipid/cholesterol/gamma-HCH transport system substrate-binding protein